MCAKKKKVYGTCTGACVPFLGNAKLLWWYWTPSAMDARTWCVLSFLAELVYYVAGLRQMYKYNTIGVIVTTLSSQTADQPTNRRSRSLVIEWRTREIKTKIVPIFYHLIYGKYISYINIRRELALTGSRKHILLRLSFFLLHNYFLHSLRYIITVNTRKELA